MKLLIALAVALSCAAIARGEETEIRLLEAIRRLESLDSYRWSTVTISTGGDRSDSESITAETWGGQTIHAVTTRGRFEAEVYIRGSRAAVRNRDRKWEAVSLEDEGYRSDGFAVSTARSVRLPAVEARQLIEAATDLRTEGEAVVGVLSSSEAKQMLANRRYRLKDVREASGTVEFDIEDGRLRGYQISVTGIVRDGDENLTASRTSEVSLHDSLGAVSAVPETAEEALRRPLPPPQRRLTDEEADEWLTARGRRDAEVHDPSSIVRSGDRYWLYATGTGIQSWNSNDLTTWERGPRVFPQTPPWVTEVASDQRGHFWAPDLIELDGRYLIYYSVSSFGVNTSAIAIASSPTLDPSSPSYGWTDHGIVIQSRRGDSFNAIDPAVCEGPGGRLWLSFGSFWDGIKLIELDKQSGQRIAPASPVYNLARYESIEAPHIYYHDDYYYLFVNWGACCRGVDSTYNIRVGRSRDVTGPYVDKDSVDLAAGGGTLLLESEGPFIGPGHANVFKNRERYWFSCHFYDATERGRSKLAIRELRWGKDGWPEVEPQRRP